MPTHFIILVALVGTNSTTGDGQGPKKPPPTLEQRCRQLLHLQASVHDDIVHLRREVARGGARGLSAAQKRAAQRLAKKQKEVADVAHRLARYLAGGGTAVVFIEVLRGLQKDMQAVQRRLEKGDVGAAAQSGAEDVLGGLRDCVRALSTRRGKGR